MGVFCGRLELSCRPRLLKLVNDILGVTDETIILNIRHLLERHDLAGQALEQVTGYLQENSLMLRQGTVVDATIISAHS